MQILRNKKNALHLKSIVSKISRFLKVEQVDLYNALEVFIQLMISNLKKNKSFEVPGVFKIELYKTKERTRVLNGKEYTIKSKNNIKVILSDGLKKELQDDNTNNDTI